MNASKIPSDVQSSSSRPLSPSEAAGLHPPESSTFSPEDYAVGRVLAGRFRVEHVIGVGSMGVVLAARHLELDERVAIKFIRSDMQRVPGVLQRFAREAKAAVSIKSEHVAQVFDVGTEEGIGPFIVMEYLEGRDLCAVLELEGRLPIRRAVHYVMQACEALAVAHANGITHRDIKPENLFLTRQGDLELIKLLDFGISKAELTGTVFGDELSGTESQCLLGTPLYMSPEQIRHTAEVDHRTDIWSLGAVLYELVTARSAFVADSVRQVWTRILETAPTPLGAHCPEAPAALQAVIDRCLEKDPARRFQNVAELAIALLPFAPSRARLYAQRASSILGTKSDSILPAPMPTPLPPMARSFVSHALDDRLPPTSMLALPISEISAPPVVGKRESRGLDNPKTSQLVALISLVGLAAALFLLWTNLRRVEPSALPLDTALAASPAALVVPRPAPAAPAAEPTQTGGSESALSRTVLIESQPSGALVKVGGQALGVTPLSTLLPVGMQELAISKPGYLPEQALVQLDPAPSGAKAVRTRVVLREAPAEVSETNRHAAARAPARKPAAKRSPESIREDGAAAPLSAAPAPSAPVPAAAAPAEATPREAAPPVPVVQEPKRVRLLEDPGRVRLLD
ncbi:MAG TPA: serine/threonine-protein kinase [Polyangiaceae bacterium]|nr:serine/threonine-protein kinase [Polyangiaceae bacterium]